MEPIRPFLVSLSGLYSAIRLRAHHVSVGKECKGIFIRVRGGRKKLGFKVWLCITFSFQTLRCAWPSSSG